MRKDTSHIEPFRLTDGELGTDKSFGFNGVFYIPVKLIPRTIATCIVSDGSMDPQTSITALIGSKLGVKPNIGWQHVSVRMAIKRGKTAAGRVPEWWEMCVIKELFWEEDEAVMQLHPAKKDYVNLHPHVLHLWKPTKEKLPLPPKLCV